MLLDIYVHHNIFYNLKQGVFNFFNFVISTSRLIFLNIFKRKNGHKIYRPQNEQ